MVQRVSPQGLTSCAITLRVARPSLLNETTEGDCQRSGLAEGVAGNQPRERDHLSMDVGARTAGGSDRKARLPTTGAGNLGDDCDEGRGAGEGPMTEGAGDGDS